MTERELEKLRQEASAQGKDSFSYVFHGTERRT